MKVIIYKTNTGKEPFILWYKQPKDKTTQLRIPKRIGLIKLANFGDHKFIENGIYELRFFIGKGYRVYYAKKENLVILLLGGDKSAQKKDISNAKIYWNDYKERFHD